MTDWNALDDSLEAATKWLESPELTTTQMRNGELENLIGFAQLYVETKNPIYAWEAFLWLQEPRLMPDWILMFIGDQGGAISQLANDKSITPVQALNKLPVKLGLKGRGNAFSNYQKDQKQADVTFDLDRLEAGGFAPGNAHYLIAKAIGKKSDNTPAAYQKKTHKNWDAQQKIIDKTNSEELPESKKSKKRT
ncbi:hypothetical protein MNBD_GAMMA13-1871 [hydrothermal vent metagenome]|uniref:Uncharacterized protein n=1 Tax=hydrothermal vent metagenome TaxID=652676 RepID=A0A3B0Y4X1_9ZZZZ